MSEATKDIKTGSDSKKSSRKKKVFAITSCILISILLILYLIGGQTYSFQTEVKVQATTQEVFAAITDSEQAAEWVDGVVKITPLTEGGFKKGAKAKILVVEQNREFILYDEVLDFQQDKYVTFRIESNLFVSEQKYSLSEDPADPLLTIVKHEVSLNHLGFSRIIAPFLEDLISTNNEHQLADLQKFLEKKQDKPVNSSEEPGDSTVSSSSDSKGK